MHDDVPNTPRLPGCISKFAARFGERVLGMSFCDVGKLALSKGIRHVYVLKEVGVCARALCHARTHTRL